MAARPKPTIAVAYKKTKGRKVYVKVFTDLACVDPIIEIKSKLLPPNTDILEIGVGKDYAEIYKKKYKVK